MFLFFQFLLQTKIVCLVFAVRLQDAWPCDLRNLGRFSHHRFVFELTPGLDQSCIFSSFFSLFCQRFCFYIFPCFGNSLLCIFPCFVWHPFTLGFLFNLIFCIKVVTLKGARYCVHDRFTILVELFLG